MNLLPHSDNEKNVLSVTLEKITDLESDIDCLKAAKKRKGTQIENLKQILHKYEDENRNNAEEGETCIDDFPRTNKRDDDQSSEKDSCFFSSCPSQDSCENARNQEILMTVLEKKIFELEHLMLNQEKYIDQLKKKVQSQDKDVQTECSGCITDRLLNVPNTSYESKMQTMRVKSDSILWQDHGEIDKFQKRNFELRFSLAKASICGIFENQDAYKCQMTNEERHDGITLNNDFTDLEQKLRCLSGWFTHEKIAGDVVLSCLHLTENLHEKLKLELEELNCANAIESPAISEYLKNAQEQFLNYENQLKEKESNLASLFEKAQQYFKLFNDPKRLEQGVMPMPSQPTSPSKLSPLRKDTDLNGRPCGESHTPLQQMESEIQSQTIQINELLRKCESYERQLMLKSSALENLHVETSRVKKEKMRAENDLDYFINQVISKENDWRNSAAEDEKSGSISSASTAIDDEQNLLQENRETQMNIEASHEPGVDSPNVKDIELLGNKVKDLSRLNHEEIGELNDKQNQFDSELQDFESKYEMLVEICRTKEASLNNANKNLEKCYNEIHKKDKLIHQLREEMNTLQVITNQLEDFQKTVREKDNKIFQLETDLDGELRLKEEKDLILQTIQCKIKTLTTEIAEKDQQLLEMRIFQEENEGTINVLRTVQATLQSDIKTREEQCNKFHDNLHKIQSVVQEMEDANRISGSEINEMKDQIKKLKRERDALQNNETTLQTQLFESVQDLKSMEKVIENWKGKISAKNQEISSMTQELENKKHYILEQQQEIESLSQNSEEQEIYIQSLTAKMESLQNDLAEKAKSSIFSLQPVFGGRKLDAPSVEQLQSELNRLQSMVKEKNKLIDNMHLSLEQKKGRLQFLHTLYITLQTNVESKDKELKASEERTEALEKEVSILFQTKFGLEKRGKVLNNEIDDKKTIISHLETELENTRKLFDDKKQRIEHVRLQLHAAQLKIEKIVKEREEKKGLLVSLQAQVQNLHHKLHNLQKDRNEKQNCMVSLQLHLNATQEELDITRKIIDRNQHKIQVLTCQLGTIKIELEDREKVIGNLQSEIDLLRIGDRERECLLEQQIEHVKNTENRLENLNTIITRLQADIDTIKTSSSCNCKSKDAAVDKPNELKIKLQLLVSEMEAWQFRLQAAQVEWEEKENLFHMLANEIDSLQNKMEDKRQASSTLDTQLTSILNTDQTKEFRLRCLYVEMQLLQEEIDSKQIQLIKATEKLQETEEKKQFIEQEVNKLLSEMESIQHQFDALTIDCK